MQWAKLSTMVDRPGIYGLNVTLSQDRYGEDVVWGLRTNCRHWVIETARGHKDERHQEPIVLMNPGHAGDVAFLPRPGPMRIEVAGLPEKVKALELYDAEGELAARLPAGGGRAEAHLTVPDAPSDAPWRLHLPEQRATVNIDGLTRWDAEPSWSALCIWSPDPATYFPMAKYRWLVTPYNRTIYGKPGQEGQTTFQVLNNSTHLGDFTWTWSSRGSLGPRSSRRMQSCSVPWSYRQSNSGTWCPPRESRGPAISVRRWSTAPRFLPMPRWRSAAGLPRPRSR